MGISISESNIVIGAEHESDKTTSKFSGEISGVLVHNKALDVEFINEVLQNTAPFATTKIVLTETVQILDTQGLSGKDAVNIYESISFQNTVNNGSIILPRIYSERIDLLSVNGTYTNSTIALNGTGFVVVEDTISSDINTMSISSWIKPEFHVGNPQYTIASKDNSFNLFIRNANVESPSHTIGFSVFDGVKWTEILGHQIIDEKWHHAMAFVNGSKISLYVNGNLEDEKTLQNEFSIGNNGQYSIQDSQISISDSEIIIGAYVSKLREEAKITDKFIGKIASVDVYTEVLNAEQISYKYETELAEIYKIISLYETIQIGDQTNLLYEFI